MVSSSLLDIPSESDLEPIDESDTAGSVRVAVPYKLKVARFNQAARSVSGTGPTAKVVQYNYMYSCRLDQLRGVVVEAAKRKWLGSGSGNTNPPLFCSRIVDARPGTDIVLVGTLHKKMKNRHNVIDEFKAQRGIGNSSTVPTEEVCSEIDSLVLEDANGSIRLTGEGIPTRSLVSGIVIAVKGELQPSGEIEISDWCPAGIPCSSDFVAGRIGEADVRSLAARIARVLICGDCVGGADLWVNNLASKGKLNMAEADALMSPIRLFDSVLAQLAAVVPVDVMPGALDPSSYMLPQRPLPHCILPQSSHFTSLNLVTNPYEAEIGGRTFVGTSGQPLNDIQRHSITKAEGRAGALERLHNTLIWRHMAPTAPESLGCYPVTDFDPFVLDKTMDVYFAGNQPSFSTQLLETEEGGRTRLVCLSPLADRGEAAIVDLETLDCTPLSFSAGMLEDNSMTAVDT